MADEEGKSQDKVEVKHLFDMPRKGVWPGKTDREPWQITRYPNEKWYVEEHALVDDEWKVVAEYQFPDWLSSLINEAYREGMHDAQRKMREAMGVREG